MQNSGWMLPLTFVSCLPSTVLTGLRLSIFLYCSLRSQAEYSFLLSASDSFVTLNLAATRALATTISSLPSDHLTLTTIWLNSSGSHCWIASADRWTVFIVQYFPETHRFYAYRPRRRSRSLLVLNRTNFLAFQYRLFTPLPQLSPGAETAQFA